MKTWHIVALAALFVGLAWLAYRIGRTIPKPATTKPAETAKRYGYGGGNTSESIDIWKN